MSNQDRRKQLQRIAVQVDQYIQLCDKIFLGSRNTVEVDAGAQKRPRRDGSAPTNDAAHKFFTDPDNADAAFKIEPAIRELRESRATLHGINLYYVVCTAGYGGAWGVDFAELRRWQQKRSKDAREHHAAYEAALDMLARMIVAECERKNIDSEIMVNPKGEDGTSDAPVDTKAEAAHQDSVETKAAQKEARDRRIRERYVELKQSVAHSDAQIRRDLCREFAPRGKLVLNRETVNAALRVLNTAAA